MLSLLMCDACSLYRLCDSLLRYVGVSLLLMRMRLVKTQALFCGIVTVRQFGFVSQAFLVEDKSAALYILRAGFS